MKPPDRRHTVLSAARMILVICAATVCLAGPSQALMISEVLFNPTGPDAGNEYIELFNDSGVTVDLADWSLGWGSNSYTEGTLDLDGAGLLAPGAYVVIGAGGVLTINPTLPNGFINAAGVALFNLDAASITATTVPDDTVIYTTFFGFNTDLIDSSGSLLAAPIDGNAVAAGETIARDAFGNWTIQAVSTPGSGPIVVPEPATALLLGCGLALLAARRRL